MRKALKRALREGAIPATAWPLEKAVDDYLDRNLPAILAQVAMLFRFDAERPRRGISTRS